MKIMQQKYRHCIPYFRERCILAPLLRYVLRHNFSRNLVAFVRWTPAKKHTGVTTKRLT